MSEKQFRIEYTSDIHGFFSPGGLSSCSSAFLKDGNTLILDGGDTIEGSPLTACLKSRSAEAAATAMNTLHYDAVGLGNHDLSFGKETAERYLQLLDCPCLCANVSGLFGSLSYFIKTLQNGLKVGVTGVTTTFVTQTEKKEHLSGLTYTEPIAAAKDAYEQMLVSGAELTVCLCHSGLERALDDGRILSDSGEDFAWELAERVPFDVLLIGHRHISVPSARIGKALIAAPSDKAKEFVRIEGTVTDGAVFAHSRLIPRSEDENEALRSALLPYVREAETILDEPVADIPEAMLPDEPLSAALNGSRIADLINDAMLWETGSDISATSLANTVTGLSEHVTLREIYGTCVFPNTLTVIETDRSVLKKAFERSLAFFSAASDETVSISKEFSDPELRFYDFDFFRGIDFSFDLTLPVGERVRSIRYRDKELPDDIKLRLCINSYRATGAGGYGFYKDCPVLYEGTREVSAILEDYLRSGRPPRIS